MRLMLIVLTDTSNTRAAVGQGLCTFWYPHFRHSQQDNTLAITKPRLLTTYKVACPGKAVHAVFRDPSTGFLG